jgi:hypothetical protein
MDGFASGGNGYPHTEQRFTLPSQAQCGGSSVFFIAMPAVYAVRAAVQGLWKSNCTTTGNSVVSQFEFFTERNILKPCHVAPMAMINHIYNPGSILRGHLSIIARMAKHTHNAAPVEAIAQNQSSIVLPRERFIRAALSSPHHVSSTISSSDQT